MRPRLIGGYRIGETLGSGPHGTVYRAVDSRTDQHVALKVFALPETMSASERAAAIGGLRSRARTAARVTHPGIARVLDVAEGDDPFFVASEPVDGTSFSTIAPRGADGSALPSDDVVHLVADAADALQAAHDLGLAHGNLHPANLVRDEHGAARVLDLGLDLPSGSDDPGRTFRSDPAYMSPERIRGQALEAASDQFSLAIVLFELLSGRRPFPGDSVASVVYRIVNEDPATLPEDRDPGAVAPVIRRALSRRPSDRYPSMTEFARALRGALAGRAGAEDARPSGVSAVPSSRSARGAERADRPTARDVTVAPTSPAARRARARRGRRLLVVAALVVVLGGIAAVVGLGRFGTGVPVPAEPEETWVEASVAVEPPGIEVLLDGVPIPDDGRIRFRPEGPFGTLSASMGCRSVEREVVPSDAGARIDLELEPTGIDARVDPGVPGATVRANGAAVGTAPVSLELDLCRVNRIEVRADGYRDAAVDLAAGSTPDAARAALASLRPEPIPIGVLALPRVSMDLIYYLDGKRLGKDERRLELLAGDYELRFRNQYFWVDGRQSVRVAAGETTTPELRIPELTALVVQAFPSNCAVELRSRGVARWTSVGETPFERRIAPGRYDVRVTLKATDESKEVAVDLKPGDNPPVRVSFARSGS